MRNILLTATLLAGIARAAEAIPYDDLANRLAPFGTSIQNRTITVVTTDGAKHKGRELWLGEAGVRLFAPKSAGAFYPKERIARIEIAQGPRFFHKIGRDVRDVGKLVGSVCGWRNETEHHEPIGCVIAAPIGGAALAVRAGVNAPFYFASGMVDALKRPIVYAIAP